MSIATKVNPSKSRHVTTQLNPSLFTGLIDSLKDKIFLYSERKPRKSNQIRFKDKKFEIIESFPINLVGSISYPKRSIRSIISSCYEKDLFLYKEYEACLFVYLGHIPSEEKILSTKAPVMLKFKVYLLKEVVKEN